MKKHSIRKWIVGTLTVFILGIIAGCGTNESTNKNSGSDIKKTSVKKTDSKNSKEDGLVIRVGNCDFAIWNAQYTIAKEKGFFEDEFEKDNVKVETYNFANGPAGNEAFTAGELDFFNGMGDQPFISGVGNGIPISVLSALNEQGKGNAIIVKKNSGIDKIKDLKGKKIGVYIGTQQHKAWLQKLSEAGLAESDVEFVNLTNFSEQYAAFEKDEIDCFFATTYNYNSINDGSVKNIGNFEEFPSRCYLVGSTEFIKKYPEITKRFFKVLKRGQDYLEKNPEDSYKILSKVSNLSFDEVKISTEETKVYLSLDDEVKKGISDTYDFLKEQKVISFDIDNLEEHYDDTFVSEVANK